MQQRAADFYAEMRMRRTVRQFSDRPVPRAISGNYVKDPSIHQYHTRQLVIRMSPGSPIQLDGELRALHLEQVAYRCLPARLDVITGDTDS